MNAARQRVLLEAQTAIARKVFDAVPIGAAWSVHAIVIEMKRLHGSAPTTHIVSGCLRALREAGLVRQMGDTHCRVPVRESVPTVMPPETLIEIMSKTETVEAPAPLKPIDRLAGVAQRLRNLAEEFADLAEEVDAAALELEAKASTPDAETVKLRALRDALKQLV